MVFAIYILLSTLKVSSKDPIRVPGNIHIEDLINATSVSLPEKTTLSCESAEITSLSSDSLITSYLNSDTVQVFKIIAKDSSLVFNGKVNITGSVTYSSKIQIGLKKSKTLSQTRFLQKIEKDWKEFEMLFKDDYLTVTKLPDHHFLNVVTNCHCEAEKLALLRVDGNVRWMENCEGTSHVSAVVKHSASRADFVFEGCDELGAVWVYFK
jgi:hypothetical protein